MKASEQYFLVVLFIMLYKMFLTFEPVDEIPKCDHLNESYWAVLSYGAVYYAVQGVSNFWFCGWNPSLPFIQMKATAQYFPAVALLIMLYKGDLELLTCGRNP